jgi:hypothetical protein
MFSSEDLRKTNNAYFVSTTQQWLILLLHIPEDWVQISARTPAVQTEAFNGLSQSLQTNAGIVP